MILMIEFLKKIPIFANLSTEDLSFLEQRVKNVEYKSNDVIFNEGDQGSSVFLIEKGEIEIFKKANQQEILLAIRTAGELLGEISILFGIKQ